MQQVSRPSPDLLRLLCQCSDTWRAMKERGEELKNLPSEPLTWLAMTQLEAQLLAPLRDRFGELRVTYGFAGPELVSAVRRRAREEGRHPNISPATDQHAGHELTRSNQRICRRDGFAVDLICPAHPSTAVVKWLVDEALAFDRIYVYDDARPFHLSWSAGTVGMVIEMRKQPSGRLVPRVVRRGPGGKPG